MRYRFGWARLSVVKRVLGGVAFRVWKTVLVSERLSMNESILEGVNLWLLESRVLA